MDCAGLGIALAGMGIIAICHEHRTIADVRITKKFRMVNRFAVCIIFFCLPTAHGLSSLELISIKTGLTIWVLLLELWGVSCPDESCFGRRGSARILLGVILVGSSWSRLLRGEMW